MGINEGFRIVGWYGIIALPAMVFGGGGRVLAVIAGS